jgi:hypothetical protein
MLTHPGFRDFQAPRGHCQAIVEPAIDRAKATLDANRGKLDRFPAELRTLRPRARDQVFADATRYTSAYRDVDSTGGSNAPVVMAGHQPTLFHPGVWFKNFALHRFASRCGAVAINLVVDSDVAGPPSIRVPVRDQATGHLGYQVIAYDKHGGGVPYEQSLVLDQEWFGTFDARVRAAALTTDPCVTGLWQHARGAIGRCGYAGCALAQARHALEAEVGLETLEIPQSVICRSESFSTFAMHILRELPRFHEAYNESTEAYRLAHGIRSAAHPVPNLRREGDWYEAPFWVYGESSPMRRGLWVRLTNGGRRIEFSDQAKRHRVIEDAHSDSAAEAFAAMASPEMKIRSRALVTTMYARLVLSDLFLHGIGGGKYDQLGDLISSRFWHTEVPEFVVLSATVLLPGHQQHSGLPIERQLESNKRDLRDIEFQPERFTDQANLPKELLERKASLLGNIPPRGNRKAWHDEVTEVNRQLRERLDDVRESLLEQRERLDRQRRDATIWNQREHPFCVYPLEYLTRTFAAMLS